MVIGILTVSLLLPGCQSLKQKRQHLRSVKDKFGHMTNIAVCEFDHQDQWQRASLAFVCTTTDKRIAESLLAKIKDYCAISIDARIIDDSIEWL